MIKAIIFDYFGVISSDEYWQMVKVDKNMTSDWLNMANRVNLGKLHWLDFMKTVAERTGKSFEEVERIYAQEKINPGVVALAQELKSQYKIGLITNAHHEFLEPILENTKLNDIFNTIVISSRVGYIKPDKRIFELALQELEIEPKEAVFIDDIERNVTAAQAMGLNGIFYKDLAQLRHELAGFL